MEKRGVNKVAIVGAESTGKTWLCEQLAQHFTTAWVPEYAREYFNNSDIYDYSLRDLEIIAEKQLELETAYLAKANNYLFCDTAMITLQIWAELEFGNPSEHLQSLINQGTYDMYLICDNTVPWQPDPQRLNKFSREMIFERNLQEVELHNTPYQIISGLEVERLRIALEACK